MQEMKIRCVSQEHADMVVAAARSMGYIPLADYKDDPKGDWDTLILHPNGGGSFWRFDSKGYPEYALYGDHLLPVSDGWIEWGGGDCPVAEDEQIEYMMNNGQRGGQFRAGGLRWRHVAGQGDIIAYRLADRQQPAEDKSGLTPCQQRGLRVGQWVWARKEADRTVDSPCWIRLMFDDGSEIPIFNESSKCVEPFVSLNNIDWSAGIHDSKPDWTPGEQAPVEWGGSDEPPVGVVCEHPTGRGVVKLPPDVNGIIIIQSMEAGSEGEYKRVAASVCRPIQSERDRAVAELADFLTRTYSISQKKRAERLYDAGYRKTESNDE